MPGVFALNSNADEVEKSQTESTQNTETTVVNADPHAAATQDQKKEEKVIVLDGPLSKIYTEALNMTYAKEDTGTMLALVQAQATLNEEKQYDQEDKAFIYCVGDDFLDQNELNVGIEHLTQAVNSGRYKKVLLALECGHKITTKVQLLDDFSRNLGVEVHYVRSKAVRSVLGKSHT